MSWEDQPGNTARQAIGGVRGPIAGPVDLSTPSATACAAAAGRLEGFSG